MAKKLYMYLNPLFRKKSDSPFKEKVVEGVFLLQNRKVIEYSEMFDHCSHCLEPLVYSELYDSTYCTECNQWSEEPCEDEDCEYCSKRPPRPLWTDQY